MFAKLYTISCTILFVAVLASAQRYDQNVLTSPSTATSFPIAHTVPNNPVAVCSQPATTNNTTGCSPAQYVTLYTDLTFTTTAPNPTTTDANGNLKFYAPCSIAPVTVVAYGSSLTTQFVLTDQYPAGCYNQEAIQYADQFSGATTNARALAACNTFSGNPGIVIIPSSMAADATPELYPQYCTIFDRRGKVGPNQFGTENTSYTFGDLIRDLFTTAPNAVQNYGPVALFLDDESGGFNTTGGPKTTYINENLNQVNRTQGTHLGINILQGGLSEGDEVVFDGAAYCFGGSNAGGDEGCEGFHFEADQGNGPLSTASTNFATATVSTATNNGGTTTLALTSGVNLQLLGELRWVIDTTVAKVYSTGTITGIAGTPPVVTGSGTTWTSLTRGQYCFSLNANSNGTLLQVIPIRTITDNTHVTLGYNVQGLDKAWAGSSNTGSYQIFPCSQIAAGGLPAGLGGTLSSPTTTATITVTNGYTLWAASDTLQVPLGFDTFIAGNFVNIGPQLPMAILPQGMTIHNLASKLYQPEAWGLGITGPWSRGIIFAPTGTANEGLDCFDGNGGLSTNKISNCVYMDQNEGNEKVAWGVPSYSAAQDTVSIGADGTSGQVSLTSSINGPLTTIDDSSPNGISGLSVNAAGSGYTFLSTITITTGSGTATALITSINGSGGITGLLLQTSGKGYTVSTGVATTGGGGTGCTVNITSVLSVPNLSGPRIVYSLQTTVVLAANCGSGDFTFSAGWNSPTSCTVANTSKDQAGLITFTTGGSPGSNPNIILTFHDGAWGDRPFCQGWFQDNTSPAASVAFMQGTNTTQMEAQYIGTPSASHIFQLQWICSSGG